MQPHKRTQRNDEIGSRKKSIPPSLLWNRDFICFSIVNNEESRNDQSKNFHFEPSFLCENDQHNSIGIFWKKFVVYVLDFSSSMDFGAHEFNSRRNLQKSYYLPWEVDDDLVDEKELIENMQGNNMNNEMKLNNMFSQGYNHFFIQGFQ